MSLRGRIAAAVEPVVREHAPQSLTDLWGRDHVTVFMPSLTIGQQSGRGKSYIAITRGSVRVQFVADTPEGLPSERLWQALARVNLPAVDGEMRVLTLTLTQINERIDQGWCSQELDFSIEADLIGV